MGERESRVRFSAVRGQSEVLAIVLLIGFVLIAAISVLVVGSAALGAAQDQSTSERNQNEITAVSHAVETSIQSGNPNTMTGLQNSYELSEGAEISITVDGNQTVDANTGQLRYDGLVYEGGLVMDGEQVVRSPTFQFEAGSSMIQIPTFIDYKNGGSFDGEIRPQGRTAPPLRPEDFLVIEIESEYSQQWADAFEGANAIVTENNGVTRVEYNVTDTGPRDISHSLSFGASDGSFNLNELPNTHIESYNGNYDQSISRHNAIMAVKENDGNNGGNLSVFGDLLFGNDLNGGGNINVTGEIKENVDLEEPTPTSELLISPDKAKNTSEAKEYQAGDDLTGGVYYVDGSTTLSSDLEVTEQSILVVDGDLTIDDATIEAKEAFDVHVHGSLNLEDGAEVTTARPHQGDQVSIFVRDDISIDGHAKVTGLLYGTSSTVDVGDSQLDIYGGMAIADLTGNSNKNHGGHFNLYYDEDLEGESPYATASVQAEILYGLNEHKHSFNIRIAELKLN